MTKHKVHFFKINAKDEWLEDGELFTSKCNRVFAQPVDVKTLPQTDGSTYRLTYFQQSGDHYEGKIVKYKTGSMVTGNVSDDILNDLTLDEGSKFAEVTHFIFSPITGILSFEYNQSGPRYAMFVRYINAVQAAIDADVVLFVAEPLFHPDALQQLDAATEVKALRISIPTNKIPDHVEQNSVLSGLRAASKFGNAGQLELTIKGTKGRGDRTPLMTTDALMTSIRDQTIDLGLFGAVDVSVATDFGPQVINLLENKFESSKEWSTPITNESAPRWFSDILSFYQTNKDDLLRSAANLKSNG